MWKLFSILRPSVASLCVVEPSGGIRRNPPMCVGVSLCTYYTFGLHVRYLSGKITLVYAADYVLTYVDRQCVHRIIVV